MIIYITKNIEEKFVIKSNFCKLLYPDLTYHEYPWRFLNLVMLEYDSFMEAFKGL